MVDDLLRILRNRVMLMVGRCVIRAVMDGGRIQAAQLKGLDGELLDEVERFQEYGLFSVPVPGMEAVIVCFGGDRDAAAIVATDSRAHRPRGQEPGDSGIYTKFDGDPAARPDASGHRLQFTKDPDTGRLQGWIRTATDATAATLYQDDAGNWSIAVTDGANTTTIAATPGQATVTSPKVVVVSPDVHLGAAGGPKVARIGDHVQVGGGSSAGLWPIVEGSEKVSAA